jgi:hypothetical protein
LIVASVIRLGNAALAQVRFEHAFQMARCEYVRSFDRIIVPRLGKRKIADINRADISRLHSELAETPATGQSGHSDGFEIDDLDRGCQPQAATFQSIPADQALPRATPA